MHTLKWYLDLNTIYLVELWYKVSSDNCCPLAIRHVEPVYRNKSHCTTFLLTLSGRIRKGSDYDSI